MFEVNNKALVKSQQPMSFTDSEVDVIFFDNLIDQEDAEYLAQHIEEDDIMRVAQEVKNKFIIHHEALRPYMQAKPKFVELKEYKYDEYPEPLRGPKDGVIVLACFTEGWSKDWGGEVLFFEQSEPSEVLASYPGRIIVSFGDSWLKVSQPNVNANKSLKYLVFRLV